jgi:hypothetical protein
MTVRSRRSIRADVRWGIGWGVWLASGFAVLGGALFVLRGSSRFSVPLVILGYFAMGLLGGVLAGLMRPLARNRWGATAMGVVIGILVYGIAMIIAVGQKRFLSPPGLASTLTLGTVIGGLFGHSSWKKYVSSR